MENTTPARYCLYARKSTEQDELQALSIDSQINEMTAMAERDGLCIVEVRNESHSAKESGQRPVFQQMIVDIKKGMFNGIIAWDPSRISRNAGDLGTIVDLMDQKVLVDIRTHGQRFTNSPNEKFLLMILCSQAKLENDHKGENVKRGLRAKCQMGWRPSPPPLGYLDNKDGKKGHKTIAIDPERAPIVRQIFERVAYEACSGRDIFRWLVDIGFRTRGDKRLALSRIFTMLKDSFYYGKFEYPVGSDIWYDGAHEPITTKEVFDRVQEQLTRVPRRTKGNHEFDFVKLIKCGSCGAGVCAEEKFKIQQNGNKHRYVYYHCTGGVDRICKEPAIREEELVRQLVTLIDRLEIDELAAMESVSREVQRFRKFSYGVLGNIPEENRKSAEIDTRNYAKYVLIEGSRDEKREILSCLKSKIILHDRGVRLEN